MNAMNRAARNNAAVARRVEIFLKRESEELYNYEIDPDALRNLTGGVTHQARLDDMRRRLLREMEAMGDPLADTFRDYLAGQGVDLSAK